MNTEKGFCSDIAKGATVAPFATALEIAHFIYYRQATGQHCWGVERYLATEKPKSLFQSLVHKNFIA